LGVPGPGLLVAVLAKRECPYSSRELLERMAAQQILHGLKKNLMIIESAPGRDVLERQLLVVAAKSTMPNGLPRHNCQPLFISL
jgi:hypothetical protein